MFNRGRIQRVLAIALSVFIGTMNTVNVSACTIDDLREMLGMVRSTEEEYLEKINVIINSYNMIEEHNELISMINSYGYKMEVNSDLKDIKKKVESEENEFEHLVKNGGSIKEIKGVLNGLEKDKEIYENLLVNEKKMDKLDFRENEYKEAYKHVMLLLENIGDETDIGNIGNNISMPTRLDMNVHEMYGNIKGKGKNTKLVISSGKYGTDAMSMFNGTVTKILKNKNKKYTIRIKVTPLLYLEYSNLDNCTVTKNQYIPSGCSIGYTKNKNKIGLKVTLDEQTINPLLLMGKKGWELYSSWIMHNPNKLESEMIESDFYTADFKSTYVVPKKDDKEIVNDKVEVQNEGGSKLKFDKDYIVPDADIIE